MAAEVGSRAIAPPRLPAGSIERAALQAVRARKDYTRYVRDYFAWARTAGTAPAEATSLIAYLEILKSRYTGGSLAPVLAAIKNGIRGAASSLLSGREAAVVSEALRSVKTPRRASAAVPRDYLLSAEEERACLERMTPRCGLRFRFLLATGARVSEALGVRIDQCRRDNRAVVCPIVGKGGKTRELRLSAELWGSIRAAHAGTTFLFETAGRKKLDRTNVYRQITRYVKRATGKHFSPHSARHVFATRMIEQTRKIQAVSEYLGHAGVAVTLSMYTHETLTDEELFGQT